MKSQAHSLTTPLGACPPHDSSGGRPIPSRPSDYPTPGAPRYPPRMGRQARELLAAALNLSNEDRAELASELLSSLEGEHDEPNDVEAAWAEEIKRRVEDLDAGRLETVSWAEVRASLDKIVNKAS